MANRKKYSNMFAGYLSSPDRRSCGPVIMSGWDKEAYTCLCYLLFEDRGAMISIHSIFPRTRGSRNPIIPDHNFMPELLEKYPEPEDFTRPAENLEQVAEADVQSEPENRFNQKSV